MHCVILTVGVLVLFTAPCFFPYRLFLCRATFLLSAVVSIYFIGSSDDSGPSDHYESKIGRQKNNKNTML